MSKFFDDPILNSPYEYPGTHWELIGGQPTEKIVESRRRAEFITPIPKTKKQKQSKHQELALGTDDGLSTEKQKYEEIPIINELRTHVDQWRQRLNQSQWQVTYATAQFGQRQRLRDFQDFSPLFHPKHANADVQSVCDKPYKHEFKIGSVVPLNCDNHTREPTQAAAEIHDLVGSSLGFQPESKNDQQAGSLSYDFATTILGNLKTAGVRQAHNEDRITFTSIPPWPGEYVAATGMYVESESEDAPEEKAAIFIGPEFGTVARTHIVAAAQSAADGGFDAEPEQIRVKISVFDGSGPQSDEIHADGIACWFIDTNYNEESFVRHAYFLGAGDPYKSLKTTLKAESNAEAWATLNSDTSRPVNKPKTGRIGVKVINHLGDEVMKVFRVKEVLE